MNRKSSATTLQHATTRNATQGKPFGRFEIHLYAIVVLLWILTVSTAHAFELYKTFQTPEAFLTEVFSGQEPAPKTLNLSNADQSRISAVFNRNFPQTRVRYWQQGTRSAWIFDDIGKEGYVPTTCGFVINQGVLEQVRVLVYRESRGEQVGELSFLDKLRGARAQGRKLDRSVDNISGATLSVQMMERMSRTALELASLIN
ncbi:MAG: FMN-binding protein [Oceanococcus sp.]